MLTDSPASAPASPAAGPPIRSVDDVIRRLDETLAWARAARSPIGFFAALYHQTTQAIKSSIQQGAFDHPQEVEQLDIAFASRYFAALTAFQGGGQPTRSWACAFDAARHWWPTTLQHLLIGMNAHINLDLGIAVASAVPAALLPAFQGDFDKVNSILGNLVPTVDSDLSIIWPLLRAINRYFSAEEQWCINLDMGDARARSWQLALTLSQLDAAARASAIDKLDARVAELSRFIRRPGLLLGGGLRIVRLGELGSVTKKIDDLLRKKQ
jgi:hypothetical protein